MRKNPVIAMLLACVLVFGVVGGAVARTPEEIMAIRYYLNDQIDILHTTGKMSTDDVFSVHVDLSGISKSTVSATVYKTVYEEATVTTYTNIQPQPIEGVNGAHDKLVRFWAYLDNNDDENFCAQWGGAPKDTVVGYVYGTTKDITLAAFVAGIPDCLGNIRLYDYGVSGGGGYSSESKTEDPEAWAEKYITTVFKPDSTTYTKTVGETTETLEMDVMPYIKDGRTYVPVRYLAYSLGVGENDIAWAQESKTVTITPNDKVVILVIGSNVMYINGEPIVMDAVPEIVDGRTMLPARWVAEALGATVEWDESLNQAVIIMPQS